MMDKLFLFRTLIISMMTCLLIFDVLRIMSHSADAFPEHKELLLTGILLWIVSVIINLGSNNDDWAGEI
jgi:cell division protein FtsW (lipid II flippase)